MLVLSKIHTTCRIAVHIEFDICLFIQYVAHVGQRVIALVVLHVSVVGSDIYKRCTTENPKAVPVSNPEHLITKPRFITDI